MSEISMQEGPAAGAAHPLVARLRALRGRVRATVGTFGLGVILAGAVGGMFALMLLDYLLHIPAGLRLALLIAWIIAIATLIWRMLLLPMGTRLTDQFLASRVELMHPQLSDELISAVHFIHARAGFSNALAARQIDLAEKRTSSIRFGEALDFRPAGKSMGAAVLVAIIAVTVGLANPALAKVAMSRWFSASPMAWPMSTHVTFDWGKGGKPPRVIPLGDKFMIRAKVDKGSPRDVWLHFWTDQSRTQTVTLTHQKEQDSAGIQYWETEISTEGNQLTMRIEAGDDHEEAPVTISLAPRPALTDLRGEIYAPPYVKDAANPSQAPAPVLVNLLSQAARATQGARVTLQIHASKPLGLDSDGRPRIALFDQVKDLPLDVPMERKLARPADRAGGSAADANDAEVSFIARQALQARVVVTDADEFVNRIGGSFSLDVVPDAMPAVVITDPRRAVERAPGGTVELTIQATDDWGFRGLKLRADKFDAKPDDPPVFAIDLPLGELATDAAVGSTTAKSKYTWDLAPLNLQPGARLSFYALVQDNYDVDGKQHDWVKSPPLSLSIKSAAEIQEEERKSLAELTERLKELDAQQDQTKAQVEAIRKNVNGSGVLSEQQLSQLAALAQQQVQEAATGSMIQQRSAQIGDDLRQNKMGGSELSNIAQEVAAGMQDVSKQNMPRAAADLSKAHEAKATQGPATNPAGNPGGNPSSGQQSGAQQSTQSMASAEGQQQQAIDTMDKLIERLGATGDFESLREDTRKIMEQQEKISDQTRELAAQMNGDHPPADAKNREQNLAGQQNDLRNQTSDLINRMVQGSQSLKQSDPGSSQSLQAAADAGTRADVAGSQGSAGKALASNQPGNAGDSQGAAQQGLQQMMDELNKNDLRKLEQLARDIRKLMDEVQKLHDDEVALNKDTTAAGAAAANDAIQKLANRQGTIQQNTIIVQKKAQGPRTAQAAAFLGEASDHMGEAATSLFASKQPPSLKPETDAITSLNQALDELKKVNDQISPDLKNKQLAEYIKQYEAIKKDQIAIKQTSDEIAKRLQADPDGELNRNDQRTVGEQANNEGALAIKIGDLSRDDQLKSIDVIVWMNQQVSDSMTTSQDRLSKVQLGPQLAQAQQTAVDRIQMIIDALKEEQKNSEFGGGGGGGGGGQPPLVPPAQQLKLLKAMQTVVNIQTKSVDQSLKTATTDADRNDYQNQAKDLGGKQEQIQTIADKLVKQVVRQ